MKTYNVQYMIDFLKPFDSVEAMAEALKAEFLDPSKRDWFMKTFERDIRYYGEHLKFNYRLTSRQYQNIRNLVLKPKQTIKVMWWE